MLLSINSARMRPKCKVIIKKYFLEIFMLNLKLSFSKTYTIIIVLFLLFNFNNVWANNFISRGYYVIDLSQKVEWMTCTVGMVWNKDKCVGIPIKVKLDQIDSVISQANDHNLVTQDYLTDLVMLAGLSIDTLNR